MRNDLYIGSPGGVVLCVDEVGAEGFAGRFFHFYSKEPETFASLDVMLFKMEKLYDTYDFPKRGTAKRDFFPKKEIPHRAKERIRVMSEKEMLENHGKQETFIVRVQHRQNSTWQGRITWADKNKTLNFRSIWEMVRMMENALIEDLPAGEVPETEKW